MEPPEDDPQIGATLDEIPEGKRETLSVALDRGQAVVIVYDGGSMGSMPRWITPVELRGVHLRAVCAIDGITKTFRVDRIRTVELVDS